MSTENCCDRFNCGDRVLTVDEAVNLLEAGIKPVAGRERVALRAAVGRVLAENVVSPLDVPPHDNSAVDGYAVCAEDLAGESAARLPVAGRVAAGHMFAGAFQRGTALRIFTGAPMPPGPDTVVMQEDCRAEDDAVVLPVAPRRGGNVRRAGEDIRAGAVVLKAGHRLRAQEIGVAAAMGQTHLEVTPQIKVALFSSGDEIADPGQTLRPGAIHDTNRYTLHALLDGMGCAVTDLGILPDRQSVVRSALAGAARGHHMIITSGGVSVGEEDHIKAAVEALGGLNFWRLQLRPGKPVALGQLGPATFVGLPGNPVSVMVTFLLIARPAILRLMGAKPEPLPHFPLPAAFSYRKKVGRRELLRGWTAEQDGVTTAQKFASESSGVLTSMVAAQGLIDLPEDVAEVNPGDMVRYVPFSGVMR